MNEWERLCRRAKRMQRTYPKGTKVMLEQMKGERGMPEGLIGTVQFVDDIGQIHVQWENGSNLALNEGSDVFRVISKSVSKEGRYHGKKER